MKWTQFIDAESMSQEGQDDLLQELYNKMFIVAYSKVHNKSDALDIVQESWLKILQKIDSLKEKDKLIQWAKAIVTNTAINALKKKNVQNRVYIYKEQMDCAERSLEMDIEDMFLRQAIYECISRLDEETKQMFIYKFYYSWRDQQIADRMGIPVGTVKARIHRGKERLRALLVKEYSYPKQKDKALLHKK